jgi:predicted transcriptional regulator
MSSLREPQPRQRHYTARHEARLDAETLSKLEDLAKTFRRKRAAILRYVMQWRVSHSEGWIVDRSPVVAVPPVPVLLEPQLLRRVQGVAAAHEVTAAAWLREAMRWITRDNVPASWRAGETTGRSPDSGYYHRKFGLRLDEETSRKLGTLTQAFHRPAAEVIRQLILQARPEDFPRSWQLAVDEQRSGEVPGVEGS